MEEQIPSLQSALQAAKFHRENDARILSGTIGELLKTLNVKHTACQMKDEEIHRLKAETTALTRELDMYRAVGETAAPLDNEFFEYVDCIVMCCERNI